MKTNLEKQIYLRCPIIFRDRNAGLQQNLMCFGFSCDDGWFQLIYDLSAAVEDIAQKLKEDGVEESNLPCVSQVKEKFGGLRFYVHNIFPGIDELIDEAEERSEQICEVCGEPGSPRGPGWIRTRCDQHAEDHNRFGDML